MITPGTILIRKNTPHPRCLQLEEDSSPNEWMSLKHNLSPCELEQELTAAGWILLEMDRSLTAMGFGFSRARVVHTALKRLIGKVKRQQCNCLEVDEVTTRSFLGIPYVTVSAHGCQMQKATLAGA